MLIAVAGRSNGLGPVLSGNTAMPVINCPPVKPDNVTQDVWSSLNVPSGLLTDYFCQKKKNYNVCDNDFKYFFSLFFRSWLHNCSLSRKCSTCSSSDPCSS